MASWKIGYPDGLDSVANEAAGKALYDKWSISPITLDSKTASVTGGQVTSIFETVLVGGSFITNAYAGGFLKIRSGTAKGEVYKIISNATNGVTCEAGTTMVTDGVAIGDWFECVTGSAHFEFPTQRNPIRKDYKRIVKGVRQRFPYYEGGVDIPLGFEADDFVVMAFLTGQSQFAALEILLNQKMDYAGYDGNFTSDEAAPLILEQGAATAAAQQMVSCNDYKVVKDGSRGGFIEVMIHFENISMPSYRGI